MKNDETIHDWAAVEELDLSLYIGETMLITIYTHYGDLIEVL